MVVGIPGRHRVWSTLCTPFAEPGAVGTCTDAWEPQSLECVEET